MTTAPDPRYPQEQMEDYQEVLAEVFEYAPLTLEAKYEFAQRLEIAVGWKLADQVQETLEFLNGTSEEVPTKPYVRSMDKVKELVQHMSRAERRAALRRRKMLVNALLAVALSSLLVSLYALGLGHEALGWFGCAASLGLAWMAYRAEEGR